MQGDTPAHGCSDILSKVHSGKIDPRDQCGVLELSSWMTGQVQWHGTGGK